MLIEKVITDEANYKCSTCGSEVYPSQAPGQLFVLDDSVDVCWSLRQGPLLGTYTASVQSTNTEPCETTTQTNTGKVLDVIIYKLQNIGN